MVSKLESMQGGLEGSDDDLILVRVAEEDFTLKSGNFLKRSFSVHTGQSLQDGLFSE